MDFSKIPKIMIIVITIEMRSMMTVTMMIMISIILMISVKIPSLDKPRDTYMEVHPPCSTKGKTFTQLQRIRMVMVMMMTVNRNMMGIRL